MGEKTLKSNTRTLKDLFAILDGRIYRWKLYNGSIDLVESDGAERSVEYDAGKYWNRWRDDNEVEEGDHLDMLFLSDGEDAIRTLPEWLFERTEESGWKREVLEQILEEEEFKGRGVTLLTEEGERMLCPQRDAGTMRLFLLSSRKFRLELGAAEELAAYGGKSVDPAAVHAGTAAGRREIVVSKRKEELIQICDDLDAVLKEAAVEYGKELPGRIESIKAQISDYVFKVYLVGPFSCGKSSLLNRWLGMEHLLPTGIAPETAISTELRYGTVSCMDLYPLREGRAVERLDGVSNANMDLVSRKANAKELLDVVIHLNHPLLKDYSDICLVDLPGLSSANPAHEAALNRFVEERAVGIFCVPMADGTVHEDSLNFLKKMERFRSEFCLLLTKADEKGASEHAAIMKATVDAIRATLGLRAEDFVSGKVSKDSVEDFVKMLNLFQERKDYYLAGRFGTDIRAIANEMTGPLNRALASPYHDPKGEENLARLEDTERHLGELVEDVMADMRQGVNPAAARIQEKVRSAVFSQKALYLSMAKGGQDCSSEVSSVIKNTIISAAPDEMGDLVERANRQADKVLGERLAAKVGDTDVDVSVAGQRAADGSGEGGFSFGSVLMGAGGAGAGFWLGNIVVPGLGGIIGGLLGGLLGRLFGGGNKKEEEDRRIDAEFTAQLEKVCADTRQPIRDVLDKAVAAYGRDLKKAAEDKMQNLKAQMQELQSQSSEDRGAWEARQGKRRDALGRINGILNRMEAWNV